jgi:hypothetical protein
MQRHESEVAATIPTNRMFFILFQTKQVSGNTLRREQDLLVSLENAALAVIDLWGNNEPRYLEGGLEWSGSSHGSDSATRWD